MILEEKQIETRICVYLIKLNKSLAPLNLTAANWRQQMSTSKRWKLHFELEDFNIILYIMWLYSLKIKVLNDNNLGEVD